MRRGEGIATTWVAAAAPCPTSLKVSVCSVVPAGTQEG